MNRYRQAIACTMIFAAGVFAAEVPRPVAPDTSSLDTARHEIDLRGVTFAGDGVAPVTIVLYVSATCPLCKRVYRDLYGAVTAGALTGKARLAVKVRSDRPADLALLAAGKFNKQSDFLLALAGVEERLCGDTLRKKWRDIGLSPADLGRSMHDSLTIGEARASAAEAAANGVAITPAAFINGRRCRVGRDAVRIAEAAEAAYRARAGDKR